MLNRLYHLLATSKKSQLIFGAEKDNLHGLFYGFCQIITHIFIFNS